MDLGVFCWFVQTLNTIKFFVVVVLMKGGINMSEETEKIHRVERAHGDHITIRKNDLWKYSTFLLAGILVIGVFMFAFGDDSGSDSNVVVKSPPSPSQPSVPSQPSIVTADADDDARIGSANAPVEIIEFSDFQCPFCGKAAPTVKQIVVEYGDKVTVVYRDFPLESIHPMALPAAIAAECVREQGGDKAFFEYHDKIFANQQALSDGSLKTWAKELGYDIDGCLGSQKYLSEVKNDLADATAAGGRGTPYFVINGKPLSGAQPFEAFKQVIDAELS